MAQSAGGQVVSREGTGQIHENTRGSKAVKLLLIGISVVFLVIMLVLPLITVIAESLKKVLRNMRTVGN